MARSEIFAFAARMWSAMRAEYELLLEHQVLAAEAACRGHLLNRRGLDAGINPRSLFNGPEDRALAFASEELVEWWADHPRLTVAEFERQWWNQTEDHQHQQQIA